MHAARGRLRSGDDERDYERAAHGRDRRNLDVRIAVECHAQDDGRRAEEKRREGGEPDRRQHRALATCARSSRTSLGSRHGHGRARRGRSRAVPSLRPDRHAVGRGLRGVPVDREAARPAAPARRRAEGDRARGRGHRRARLRDGDAAVRPSTTRCRRSRSSRMSTRRARHPARASSRSGSATTAARSRSASSGQVIRPKESPQLEHHAGHELITTDGTTLLGADDKSGIAEIMAAVAHLHAHPEIPHGPVKVAFNPDEEIGRGVIHFPVDAFGVAAAYTVDGSTAGEVQSETFSGAQVRMYIRGRAIHPGWAKGELVECDQARRRDRREAAEGLALAGDDGGARGLRPPGRDLRRLVRGRAPLHRARLRERPARRAHRVPARHRARRRGDGRALLDRGRVAHPVPQHARRARPASGDRREPRGSRSPRRPRAEAHVDPRRHRRLGADRDGPADAEHLHRRPRRAQRARVDLRRGHGPGGGDDRRTGQGLGGAEG